MTTLEPVADELWTADRWVKLRGGLWFPVRMVVVRLPGGGLWLHSPIEIDDDLAAELDALGPVEDLVAPNHQHFLFAASARQRYPRARLWGAPGLPARRRSIPFDRELGPDAPAEWQGALDQRVIDGAPSMSEVEFFHRSTGTLLATDLVFNIAKTRGWVGAIFLSMTGTRGKLAQSRVWRFLIKDRAAVRESVSDVLRWPIERIVMSHGDVLCDDTVERLSRALARLGPTADRRTLQG